MAGRYPYGGVDTGDLMQMSGGNPFYLPTMAGPNLGGFGPVIANIMAKRQQMQMLEQQQKQQAAEQEYKRKQDAIKLYLEQRKTEFPYWKEVADQALKAQNHDALVRVFKGFLPKDFSGNVENMPDGLMSSVIQSVLSRVGTKTPWEEKGFPDMRSWLEYLEKETAAKTREKPDDSTKKYLSLAKAAVDNLNNVDASMKGSWTDTLTPYSTPPDLMSRLDIARRYVKIGTVGQYSKQDQDIIGALYDDSTKLSPPAPTMKEGAWNFAKKATTPPKPKIGEIRIAQTGPLKGKRVVWTKDENGNEGWAEY